MRKDHWEYPGKVLTRIYLTITKGTVRARMMKQSFPSKPKHKFYLIHDSFQIASTYSEVFGFVPILKKIGISQVGNGSIHRKSGKSIANQSLFTSITKTLA